MDKKFVFVYFGQKALCSTPEQAFDFINSLYYHGNSKSKLTCNKGCMGRIWKLYAGLELNEGNGELWTTGCSSTRIKVYPALADTLDEHERIYAEKAAAAKAERLRENEKRLNEIVAELDKQQQGKYKVHLSYGQRDYDTFRTELCEFEGRVLADSGRDAYAKLVKYIEDAPPVGLSPNTPVMNVFPAPFSNDFNFEYLGEKGPDDADAIVLEYPEDREANNFLKITFE
ncbi:hypothetical protein [Alistipes finegoldii]|uniref:hypothetical protein n=1 Tax=Alistipes finegoldii TaxID=214856 RepID=UPI00242F669A|nr:hypothetical protein [Alistipes finegoldii]